MLDILKFKSLSKFLGLFNSSIGKILKFFKKLNLLFYTVGFAYDDQKQNELPIEKFDYKLELEIINDKESPDNLGDLKVSKDEIIENVAEKILTQEKTVAVVDSNNQIIGSINPSKIINTVFGGRKNNS